ncbi:hypothetical protein A2272_06830 [Candidatus Peregrinibacteria bacterium RIFOXYA12_FULL_33_12]|nr:MAG: hypothetical protein A2263_00465 [Candidatus Peregrinibacteria bacterium RIFOXYA2_FULL_33_21]OGJ46902.1 MAG: hypothetical protein A2272_06830 [Candidatus Peregrinibacteria bacterium RIFOXYA12_FULL_33_12]OGJ51766.1 MAG: hypothetical protein A2307_05900 [Candidatus Peregrinibacteria bacterium RIFOXYB2_FULL_33_20]
MDKIENEIIKSFLTKKSIGEDLEITKDNILRIGLQIAFEMGYRLQLARFRGKVSAHVKNDGTNVTGIDQCIENETRDLIKKAFPQHVIVGEENGGSLEQHQYNWIVDPIDSTNAYMSFENTSSFTLALLKDDEIIMGIVYNPFTGELFYGIDAFRSRLITRINFSNEYMAVNLPFEQVQEDRSFVDIHPRKHSVPIIYKFEQAWADGKIHKVLSTGGSPAFGISSSAKGAIIYISDWESVASPWDLVAATKIVRNAGGDIVDVNGSSIDPFSHQGIFVSAINRKFTDQALEIINR